MALCSSCGQDILFGGRKLNGRRYCNDKCASAEVVHSAADGVPLETVQLKTLEVFDGTCPECEGPGPVDIRKSHMALSYLAGCSWWSKNQISCMQCGTRAQIKAAIITGLIGWISIPGLVIAPFQIIRNIVAAIRGDNSTVPSEELEKVIRYNLVQSTLSATPSLQPSSPLQKT